MDLDLGLERLVWENRSRQRQNYLTTLCQNKEVLEYVGTKMSFLHQNFGAAGRHPPRFSVQREDWPESVLYLCSVAHSQFGGKDRHKHISFVVWCFFH